MAAVPGLLTVPQTFYVGNLHAETGAYALEWINAFAHLDPRLTSSLRLHGGTLAQLHLGELQRLSRDIDLIGDHRGRMEEILDRIAQRYDDRLFTWEETPIVESDIEMQRFSAFFPSAQEPDVTVPLKIDVTYLPVRLAAQSIRLSESRIYRPINPDDSVETLTPGAFIADKLPTLGFDTLGYHRGGGVLGHPDQVWKQQHDISALVSKVTNFGEVLPLYSHGVEARNRARGLNYEVQNCLDDAWRVSAVSLAAAVYPRNGERPGDAHYVEDVQELRDGLGGYRAYCLHEPAPLELATRSGLLTRGLSALARGDCDPDALHLIFTRIDRLGLEVAASAGLRNALRNLLGRRQNPDGWDVPVDSRLLLGLRPTAAIAAYVATNVSVEARELSKTGRFTFEPRDEPETSFRAAS